MNSLRFANFIMDNMDANKLDTIQEMSKDFTPEQVEAWAELCTWFSVGGAKSGYKKGFIVGGVTATAVLTAYAIYCYKKAHKDENQER